jgi:hypothetical protein
MASKIDKEWLLKHHFWILAGLVLPLELFAFIWLSTSVASDNDKDKKAIEKAKTDLKALNDIKNQDFLNALERKNKKVSQRKGIVWNQVWDKQKGIFTWPNLDGAEERLTNQASFMDPIDNVTCSTFEQRYADYVTSVFDPMGEHFPGDPGWRDLVKTVPKWTTRPPDSEDLWLAMEDIWVQRELLDVIIEANKAASDFHKVEPSAEVKLPANTERFENPYWRLDLSLVQGHLIGDITNITKRRQMLNVTFLVDLHKTGRPYELSLNHRTKAAGESYHFDKNVQGFNPAGIYGVKQKLDKRSVPVRRILQLKMDYNSDRTSHRGLRARPQPGEKAGEGGGESRNGLPRARYIDVTDQVRRLPVAMTVLIDERFMQDLLRAFANSKLRIQTTQMHWQHAEDSPGRTGPGGGLGMPGMPGLGGTPAAPAAGTNEEEESALVELSIYGIASLYERPKVQAPAGTPGAPGATAAPGKATGPGTPAAAPGTPAGPGTPAAPKK